MLSNPTKVDFAPQRYVCDFQYVLLKAILGWDFLSNKIPVKYPSDECYRNPLMITQNCLRYWLGAVRHQAITCTNIDQFPWHSLPSPGVNGSKHTSKNLSYLQTQQTTVSVCQAITLIVRSAQLTGAPLILGNVCWGGWWGGWVVCVSTQPYHNYLLCSFLNFMHSFLDLINNPMIVALWD